MRELFILIAHLLVTLAKALHPGRSWGVATESLAVKHQLLIMKRAQRRAPKLTSWDHGRDGGLHPPHHRLWRRDGGSR